KVLFIDASNQVRIGRAQNYLEKQHVDQIYQWYKESKDVTNHCKLVELQVIENKEFNLNIPLYIEKQTEDNLPTLEDALNQLETAAEEAWKAEDLFKALLKDFKLLN
ncbi:MAG: DNA methylase, partial [Sphingobacteriales bacterium]